MNRSDKALSTTASTPGSLRSPGLAVLWERARAQLDRRGDVWRGQIARPDLGNTDMLALTSLLGRRPPQRVDMGELEKAFSGLSLGSDLDAALTVLGAPPSVTSIERRRADARRVEVAEAVSSTVHAWPEAWAEDFGGDLLRSGRLFGADVATARTLLDGVRSVIDEVRAGGKSGQRLRRNDLAADLFGSAHALDDGQLLERCCRLAFRFEHDIVDDTPVREVWAVAGVDADLVSAPVLCWNLELLPGTPLGKLCAAATGAGVPIHLTAMALGRHEVALRSDERVLLVENPRLVEAAAERVVPFAVIATNGNPTSAVIMLVDDLVAAGVEVRHHGDFDAAGIAIVRRMADRGTVPWRMEARRYETEVQRAVAAGVELPNDARPCGPTPWCPSLEVQFDECRAIVHEERLIDSLLDPATWSQ